MQRFFRIEIEHQGRAHRLGIYQSTGGTKDSTYFTVDDSPTINALGLPFRMSIRKTNGKDEVYFDYRCRTPLSLELSSKIYKAIQDDLNNYLKPIVTQPDIEFKCSIPSVRDILGS
ncbi:hypothetical protein [Chitinophaga nivalis]|uniref:Uncharacterized protein n=1 Tax=Chitinophaga nivalis TaxID=2991709 RepID=A0ABT3IIP8_9BACT|nr:hypothetical protein [Chitinophaga nivalis]MCW3466483.1 hypothetical protein [Chitinophaga nivalis]MCW3483826.1 hypothetical protein [Chitinophaga nivalis]